MVKEIIEKKYRKDSKKRMPFYFYLRVVGAFCTRQI